MWCRDTDTCSSTGQLRLVIIMSLCLAIRLHSKTTTRWANCSPAQLVCSQTYKSKRITYTNSASGTLLLWLLMSQSAQLCAAACDVMMCIMQALYAASCPRTQLAGSSMERPWTLLLGLPHATTPMSVRPAVRLHAARATTAHCQQPARYVDSSHWQGVACKHNRIPSLAS
jgi:hypothetical protein